MKSYIARRLLQLIPVLLGIAVISFLLLHIIPGDAASVLLGQEASPEEIERLQKNLGLDRPLYEQLINYLINIVQLDFGSSIFRGEEVIDIIAVALPATLELAVVAMIISLVISVPLGILAAVKHNTIFDYFSMFFAQLGISMPVFWMGVLFILIFSVQLGVLPSFGRAAPLSDSFITLVTSGNAEPIFTSLRHLFLPALSLGVMGSALITRMIRSTMIEVLDMDYIRTIRAGGTSERLVVMKYAFKNALLPVITIVGLQFGNLLGGAIVTETIFGWPGLGSLVISSISQRDFPIVQGVVLTIALLFALVNLIVDLLYAKINPKISQD